MISRLNRVLDTFIGKIERAESLDPIADKLSAALSKPLSPAPMRSILSGTPVGHPAHPAMVLVPVGSWLSATYLDLVGGTDGERAARRLVAMGVVSAVPAALTGANDWMYTSGAERRVGLVHAAGNYFALGLYLGSWTARRRQRVGLGKALAAAGSVTVTLTGWLGGHLTYARGVGVDTTAFEVVPSEWTDVFSEADLQPEEPVLVHADGVPVMLVKSGDELLAIGDRCTHRGGPLHEGTFKDGCITCPWHGGTFRVSDGQVLEGPPSRSEQVCEVRIRYGLVQVRRADEPGALRGNPVS